MSEFEELSKTSASASQLSGTMTQEYLEYIQSVLDMENKVQKANDEYESVLIKAKNIFYKPSRDLYMLQKNLGAVYKSGVYHYKGILDEEMPNVPKKSYKDMTDSDDILLNVEKYPSRINILGVLAVIIGSILFVLGMVLIGTTRGLFPIILTLISFAMIIAAIVPSLAKRKNYGRAIENAEDAYIRAKNEYLVYAPEVESANRRRINLSTELEDLYNQEVLPPAFRKKEKILALGYIFTNLMPTSLKEALHLCEQMDYRVYVRVLLTRLAKDSSISKAIAEENQSLIASSMSSMQQQIEGLSGQLSDANKAIDKLSNPS